MLFITLIVLIRSCLPYKKKVNVVWLHIIEEQVFQRPTDARKLKETFRELA